MTSFRFPVSYTGILCLVTKQRRQRILLYIPFLKLVISPIPVPVPISDPLDIPLFQSHVI